MRKKEGEEQEEEEERKKRIHMPRLAILLRQKFKIGSMLRRVPKLGGRGGDGDRDKYARWCRARMLVSSHRWGASSASRVWLPFKRA